MWATSKALFALHIYCMKSEYLPLFTYGIRWLLSIGDKCLSSMMCIGIYTLVATALAVDITEVQRVGSQGVDTHLVSLAIS